MLVTDFKDITSLCNSVFVSDFYLKYLYWSNTILMSLQHPETTTMIVSKKNFRPMLFLKSHQGVKQNTWPKIKMLLTNFKRTIIKSCPRPYVQKVSYSFWKIYLPLYDKGDTKMAPGIFTKLFKKIDSFHTMYRWIKRKALQ